MSSAVPAPAPRGFAFYPLCVLAFLAAAGVLYHFFPQFVVQSHDGNFSYALLRSLSTWTDPLPGRTPIDWLEGMGSPTYAYNVYLLPHTYPVWLFSQPKLQVYFSYVTAATLLFCSLLFFYSSLQLSRQTVVAAAWLTFVFYYLFSDIAVACPQFMLLYHVSLLLGLFVHLGRWRLVANLLTAGSFVGVCFVFVLAELPACVLAVPTLVVFSAAVLLSASSRREACWKAATGLAAVLLLAASGCVELNQLLVHNTARYLMTAELAQQSHSMHTAGVPFHSWPNPAIVVMFVLSACAAAVLLTRPGGLDRRVRAVLLAYAATVVLGLVAGVLFCATSVRWVWPAPWYFSWCSYPMLCLSVALGVERVALTREHARLARDAAVAAVVVALFAAGRRALHLPWARDGAVALAVCAGGWLLVRCGLRRAVLPAFCVGLTLSAYWSPYAWIDRSPDMARRLSLRPTPVALFLAERTALRPGMPFRGYVDDYYTSGAPVANVVQELMTTWHANLHRYQSGLRTFGWHVWDIPTLSQYGACITPSYYYLYTRLLNRPSEEQSVNHLMMTRVSPKVLEMLGMRYLVTNAHDPVIYHQMRRVFEWDGLAVYETQHPNLFSYSPTRVSCAALWEEAVRRIDADDFDPRRDVVLHDDRLTGETLVPAETLGVTIRKYGFDIRARSGGKSLLLLPAQFSHCFKLVPRGGDGRARLLRANVCQSAILFTGELDAEVRWECGFFGRHDDLREDVAEALKASARR
jgi:hypothetical protein